MSFWTDVRNRRGYNIWILWKGVNCLCKINPPWTQSINYSPSYSPAISLPSPGFWVERIFNMKKPIEYKARIDMRERIQQFYSYNVLNCCRHIKGLHLAKHLISKRNELLFKCWRAWLQLRQHFYLLSEERLLIKYLSPLILFIGCPLIQTICRSIVSLIKRLPNASQLTPSFGLRFIQRPSPIRQSDN